MKILRATHLGMCFGVRDALTLARQTAARESVTVLGQLVHNTSVLTELQRAGVRFAELPGEVRTDAIIILSLIHI
jgi:4-hydroxy-3-methylbut-2-enyl diphosphate reductase